MKVIWKHRNNAKMDITVIVASVTWAGSTEQAARVAELSIIDAPDDSNIVKMNIKIALGDVIELREQGTLLFYGIVQTKEKTGQNGTAAYSCMDLLCHLLRSTGVYNFKDTTPERITRQVCADFQIPVGTLEETKVTIKKMIVDGESIYDIIVRAYKKASKQTGKKYICRMSGKTLTVEERGKAAATLLLEEGNNISDIHHQETLENMVNLVKIYNAKGKQIGEVKKDDWIKNYGIFQQIYKKEKGVNETIAANHLLNGIKKTLTLNAINGNVESIAGKAIKLKDKTLKLEGLFWIIADSHTWENGIHTMNLELKFRNMTGG